VVEASAFWSQTPAPQSAVVQQNFMHTPSMQARPPEQKAPTEGPQGWQIPASLGGG
jgi:hypothetical protein